MRPKRGGKKNIQEGKEICRGHTGCPGVTVAGCGRLCFLALWGCDASCPSVSLAVSGAVGLVVAMTLPGHPDTNKQSSVA